MNSDYNCTARIYCNQGAIRAVRFSEDGAYCITSGSNKKVKLWNPYKSILLKTYAGHGNEVMDACSSCDQSQIASCSVDKSIIIWDVIAGTPVRRLRCHTGIVTTVRFNELSTMIVSGSQDNSVMLWDIRAKTLTPVQVLADAKDSVSSVRISDHEILTASYDSKVRRYDIREGRLVTDCMGEIITCASFTKDNRCIVVSCADGTVKLIDKDTGELLGEYEGLTKNDYCIESTVNYDDKLVLSGSADGRVWAWDLISRQVVMHLFDDKSSKHPTISLSTHPTKNSFLAANGSDILLWEKQELA
ncbi:WD repeat domain-containing protein 83 [Copidosoma floridanum]|uniref:WD repeat domain-containing protein 83 n=1 Tax=Copidosoma floridanum TaxID=29053 RepID=UPI0006C9E4D5|nr:WD repeat domain-containing protein 83 [Copidosoma floridanum]